MPRRFVAAARLHQDRLAEGADRSLTNASRSTTANNDDGADLMSEVPSGERAALATRYAAGTSHTGTITARRAGGWVVSFGKFSGILPFNKTGGASLAIRGRVKVKVVEFDGQRPPQLTR